jgi:LmbE family N-acetylglucosaminyl deacetylase
MNENPEQRLLAIFAHPDDESFGAGGLLAKYAHQGVRVIVVSVTCGDAGIEGLSAKEAGEIRHHELVGAASQLGGEAYCLGYPDGKLADTNPNLLLEHIAAWICLVQPQVILTFGPEGISGHPDHITVSQMVTKAYDRCYNQGMLLYIHPSEATVLGCGVSDTNMDVGKPRVDVDISEFKPEKVRAIQSHVSQQPNLPKVLEEAAGQLASHEIYTLARLNEPISWFEEVIEEKR